MWAHIYQMFQSRLESGRLVLPGHSLPAPLFYLLSSLSLTWVQTSTYKTSTEYTITLHWLLRVNTQTHTLEARGGQQGDKQK